MSEFQIFEAKLKIYKKKWPPFWSKGYFILKFWLDIRIPHAKYAGSKKPYCSTLSPSRSGILQQNAVLPVLLRQGPISSLPGLWLRPAHNGAPVLLPEEPHGSRTSAPLQTALFISSTPSFADLPPIPQLPGGPPLPPF